MGRWWILLLVLLTAVPTGCARWHAVHGRRNVSTRPTAVQHDTATAKLKHQQALRHLATHRHQEHHLPKAEKLLRDALVADNEFGPAHNNLGQIYYQQGKYYQAAWEFESAAGLMPDRPEPLNNLGLVYEAALRFPDAIHNFQLAHELAPTNPVYLGNLVRAMLRDDDQDREAIGHLLHELLFIETRPDWRDWAQQQQAALLVKSPGGNAVEKAGSPSS